MSMQHQSKVLSLMCYAVELVGRPALFSALENLALRIYKYSHAPGPLSFAAINEAPRQAGPKWSWGRAAYICHGPTELSLPDTEQKSTPFAHDSVPKEDPLLNVQPLTTEPLGIMALCGCVNDTKP